MKRLVGLLDKIRVIKESSLMVRFTLVSIDKQQEYANVIFHRLRTKQCQVCLYE